MNVAQHARRLLKRVVADMGAPPVRLYFRKKEMDAAGEINWYEPKGEAVISLRANLNIDQEKLEDTVIHELAHAYAGPQGAGDHDAVWGVHYARIYCAAMGSH